MAAQLSQPVQVDAAMRDPHFKIRVARENVCATDLQRLKPGTWLNDELINFYAALIQQRADADPKRKVHFFSSFWWTKMLAQGYQKGMLARWTKKVRAPGARVEASTEPPREVD